MAVLEKMHAPPKPELPFITPEILAEVLQRIRPISLSFDMAPLIQADGVLLGIPTRFGMMASQMKAFLDATGGLWQK